MIASYSRTGAFLYSLILILLLTATVFVPITARTYLMTKGWFWIPGLCFALFTGVIALAMQLILLRLVFFESGKVFWIEGGSFINFHRWFMEVPCHLISNIEVGEFGWFRQKGLVLQMMNAEQREVPTWMASESAEVIAERLKRALRSSSECFAVRS